MTWLVETHTERLILELREILVRLDENQAAWTLLDECVPHILHGNRRIAQAKADQERMVAHLLWPEKYRDYYEDNVHERPFEEQRPGVTVADAHKHIYRVKFLRDGLAKQGEHLTVLDLACNDGWMAANLADAGHYCSGIDLGKACIDRARNRTRNGDFVCDDILNAVKHFGTHRFDAVSALELIEHVRDPDELLRVMVALVKPDGRLYASTPNATDHKGDLPGWDHVEPKGHVRVFIPETFHEMLSRHGEVEQMDCGPDGVLVARVKPR